MITMKIKIKPKAAPRPRLSANGIAYNENWYKVYKRQLMQEIKFQSPAYLSNDPVSLDITFSKPCEPTSHLYGDIDNLVKGVMDACNGVVWKDDKQVVDVTARKINNTDEYIEIKIIFFLPAVLKNVD